MNQQKDKVYSEKNKPYEQNVFSYEYNSEQVEDVEYVYHCPCGKGKIVETKDDTPGNREHMIYIMCKECSKRYRVEKNYIGGWDLVEMVTETEGNSTGESVLMDKGTTESDSMGMIKKKWDKFLEQLPDKKDGEISFDADLKGYLRAIKYVSEIEAEKIDEVVKEEIESHLQAIVEFIDIYGKDYYEIGRIKGFKSNKDDMNGWIRSGRDYYYYIADQKMKASVYYIRYLNFLDKTSDKVYLENLNKKMETEGCGDVFCGEINENKLSDQNYLKYMLFNNMMREIAYYGGAFQYLWHWDYKTNINLFRCHVEIESAPHDDRESVNALKEKSYTSKQEFLKIMFNSIVDHMNHPTHLLRSYSQDPYIDIYKYLNLGKETGDKWDVVNVGQIAKINIAVKNAKGVIFEIVKNAKINSIRRNADQTKDFYTFVQDGNEVKIGEELSFTAELYADLPATDKNEKGTSRNIKPKLKSYFSTWIEDSKQIMSLVADDKEVVVYGTIEDSYIRVQQGDSNVRESLLMDESAAKIKRYGIKIDKEALLYLLLKINEDINNVKFDYKIKRDSLKKRASDAKWECKVTMGDLDDAFIDVEAELLDEEQLFKGLEDGKKQSEMERKKVILQFLKKQINAFFENRYAGILGRKNYSAELILEFMKRNSYECPGYISTYNLYEIGGLDPEIILLKEEIFKKGM